MITKEDFKQKFNQSFSKQIKAFKKIKVFSICWLIFMTFIVAGVCYVLHYFLDTDNQQWPIYVLAGILTWFAFVMAPILGIKDRVLKKYKKFDFGKMLSIIFDDKIYYNSHEFVDKNLFIKSNFITDSFNSYKGEDLFAFQISGTHKGEQTTTAFVASDILVQNISYDNKKKKVSTLFDGIFCAIKFRKNFKCNLEINSSKKSDLSVLETESSDFNKKFKVQTNNQIEARLILTLTFMNKLLDYQNQNKYKMGFVFKEEYLYIFIEKELFKFSNEDDNFDFKLVEPIYDDIKLLNDLATEIQNNKKVFKI